MIGFINKIIPFSSVDGPGNRTAIFLQGCNFNCVYCHNPETIKICKDCGKCIEVCPTNAISVEDGKVIWNKEHCCNCDACIKACNNNSTPKILKMSANDVVNEIVKYKSFIQGITVSGGECTLQEEFLIELFIKAKELELNCFIDSNGSKDFSEMNKLVEVCDKVMLDVKCFDKDKHKKYISFDNENTLKNLEYLASINKLYEVRTVIVEEIFDNEETVREVSKIISKYDKEIKYKLISFRNVGVKGILENRKSPSKEYMEKLKKIVEEYNCNNVVII